MENPNNQVRLRRHSTLHPRLQRHSTLHRRASTAFRNRLNKNNPYVGFIRHAPSATDRLQALFEKKLGESRIESPKSLDIKSSPHIGWFRHAPHSRSQLKRLEHIERNVETLVATYNAKNKVNSSKNMCTHPIIDGKLKGGAPALLNDLNFDFDAIHRNLQDCEAGSPSATIQVLSRLASWFLFPLAHDESSCGYHHDRITTKAPLDTPERPLYGNENNSDDDSDDDDSSTDSIQTVGTLLPLDNIEARNIVVSAPYIPTNGLANSAVTILSEVCDDYDSEMGDIPFCSDPITNEGTAEASFHSAIHFEEDELDFVITQMDIARMARNAARHLDVESIWNLPTSTYRAPAKPPTREFDGMGDGSWLIIPESTSSPKQESVCVICLEAFCDGDRLRVLPCEHAFHMGCIDRWLSGCHSFVDCDTSGCPICKKKPQDNVLDGSVPSWAFARLGESLAKL